MVTFHVFIDMFCDSINCNYIWKEIEKRVVSLIPCEVDNSNFVVKIRKIIHLLSNLVYSFNKVFIAWNLTVVELNGLNSEVIYDLIK